MSNYEGILKLAALGVEWDGVGVEGYESDWEADDDYETDDESEN